MGKSTLDSVILFQGLYYLLTGIWPIVHVKSFEFVTGPKSSHFLLHMVALLIVIISITLLLSVKKEKSRELLFLACSSPIAFMIIETWYRTEIRWVYFLDFAVQTVILVAIVYGIITAKKRLSSQEERV